MVREVHVGRVPRQPNGDEAVSCRLREPRGVAVRLFSRRWAGDQLLDGGLGQGNRVRRTATRRGTGKVREQSASRFRMLLPRKMKAAAVVAAPDAVALGVAGGAVRVGEVPSVDVDGVARGSPMLDVQPASNDAAVTAKTTPRRTLIDPLSARPQFVEPRTSTSSASKPTSQPPGGVGDVGVDRARHQTPFGETRSAAPSSNRGSSLTTLTIH